MSMHIEIHRRRYDVPAGKPNETYQVILGGTVVLPTLTRDDAIALRTAFDCLLMLDPAPSDITFAGTGL